MHDRYNLSLLSDVDGDEGAPQAPDNEHDEKGGGGPVGLLRTLAHSASKRFANSIFPIGGGLPGASAAAQ